MACTANQDEWTFHMVVDRTGDETILIFCLGVDHGVVTGTVTDENGNPLSTDVRVKGTRIPLGGLGIHVSTGELAMEAMTLRFRWDTNGKPIKVRLLGSIFQDASDLVKFEGRFLAYPGLLPFASEGKRIMAGPDTGDTGTGNGQQT